MRVFFLGPGKFQGDASKNALYRRLSLAEYLESHDVEILEFAEDVNALTEKFRTVMNRCDAVIVWLPLRGELNTVFGELLMMRYEHDWHGIPVTIFAESGVLEASTDQFEVLHPAGQIGFLLDLPQYYDLGIFEYETAEELARLFRMYDQGMLEP